MKKLILCLIVGLFFVSFAEARLGETFPELEKRFGKGKPLEKYNVKAPATSGYLFNKNGINIFAYFIGDKCVLISYSNTKKLTEEEVKKLLNANGGFNRWIPDKHPVKYLSIAISKPSKSWHRDDKKVYAGYQGTSIYFLTQNYIVKKQEIDEKNKAEKQKKEKHKLDGF